MLPLLPLRLVITLPLLQLQLLPSILLMMPLLPRPRLLSLLPLLLPRRESTLPLLPSQLKLFQSQSLLPQLPQLLPHLPHSQQSPMPESELDSHISTVTTTELIHTTTDMLDTHMLLDTHTSTLFQLPLRRLTNKKDPPLDWPANMIETMA